MPVEQPVSGCTGKGGGFGGGGASGGWDSGGGGGGKKVGGSSSKGAAKPASKPEPAQPDDGWKAGPVQDRKVEKPTTEGSGWTEIPPGGMPALKQNVSGLGDLVSSGPSLPLLKGAGFPATGDLVSSATSSLPGDLVNNASRIVSAVQNPESIKDAAVAAGRGKVAQALDKAKRAVLEKSGIGDMQGKMTKLSEKPKELLDDRKINPEDVIKKM
jgi:hypothetical protein